MTDGEWHGWRTPEGTLSIGPMPGRKRIALSIVQSNEYVASILPVAYFANEDLARQALRLLDLLAAGVVDEDSSTGESNES